MFSIPIVSRERLERLTFFRVVVVTGFLLFALIFDVESISNLTEARSTTLLFLIIASYVLSILYSIVIRQMDNVSSLGIIQVSLDLVISAVFISITGGLSSLFVFLFHLIIVSAASVLGRKVGLLSATITSFFLGVMVLGELGFFDTFFPYIEFQKHTQDLGFRAFVFSSSGFVLALLSGYLSERVGQITTALEEERKNAVEQQVLNEYILDGISSGVVTIDETKKIIFFNQAAVQITEMEKESALGLSFEIAFPELGKIVKNIESTSAKRLEADYKTKSGRKLFLGFSISPLNIGEDRRGQIIIFQNLTDIRVMESKLLRNQRLAAVGELAASIAHEIRNPLAAISGSVEMLEADSEVDSEASLLHGIVLREVERLNALISGFLEYSRPRKLHIQPFDLNFFMDELLVLMRNQNQNLEIFFEGLSGITLNADETVLKQILWNLLINGADAMDAKGKILISFTRSSVDGRIIFCVEDDGPGIAVDERERVFEPFYTSKSGGTGLGLATIFRLVEEHEGEIEIGDGRTLKGARFEFNLGLK